MTDLCKNKLAKHTGLLLYLPMIGCRRPTVSRLSIFQMISEQAAKWSGILCFVAMVEP